jgi:hypothetical protein
VKLTDYLDVRFFEVEAISSSLNLSVFAVASRKSYLFWLVVEAKEILKCSYFGAFAERH